MKIEVFLTEEDIALAIKDYVKRYMSIDVDTKDISFKLEQRSEGYGMGEHTVTRFKGAYLK